MPSEVKVTAKDIANLLAIKHAKDVFFEEVNLGSATANCQRIDAWAMPRSWARWTTHGYEIKVSRSDFLRDDKWHAYREHVEHMWFVCPHGLIQPEELPEGVGLMWAAKTGTRLYTKRKAAKGEANATEAMVYLLMSRTKPHQGYMCDEDPALYWRQWLAKKRENRSLGHAASRAVRERAFDLQRENESLHRENRKLEEVKAEIKRLELGGWDPASELRRKVERERQVVSRDLTRRLQYAHRSLGDALERIEELKGEKEPSDA
jgi:hypothetical protein